MLPPLNPCKRLLPGDTSPHHQEHHTLNATSPAAAMKAHTAKGTARKTYSPLTTAIALREDWLNQLARAFMAHITDITGLAFPPVRVTCGFPSRGGEMGGKTRVRGQCWSADASEDKHAEIFISPVEADDETVAAILAHELVHASIPEAGHGKPFQRAMAKLGHVAPFTTATATQVFWDWARPHLEAVGPYPHAMLLAMRPVAAPKKQVARMLKCTCMEDDCGYSVRGARKWLLEVGFPICPKHMVPMICEVDLSEPEDGEDEGDEG